MTSKEIVRKAMKDKGYTFATLAELAGYKRASNISELVRSDNMRVDSFVKLMGAMGYRVIVEDCSNNANEKIRVTEATAAADETPAPKKTIDLDKILRG